MSAIALHLSPEEISALRRRERADETANLFFQCCPCCMFPVWVSTQSSGTGQTFVTLEKFEPRLCDPCAEARYQSPVIFDLVLRATVGARLFERWAAEPSSEVKK